MYGASDKALHELMVHVGHDLLAEEEAYCDEVAVEVLYFLYVCFDISHHLGEKGQLSHTDASRWLSTWAWLGACIKDNHERGH